MRDYNPAAALISSIRLIGFFAATLKLFFHGYFRSFIFHAEIKLLQRIAFHMRTVIAGAGIIRWSGYKCFFRIRFHHLVKNSRFCSNNIFLGSI